MTNLVLFLPSLLALRDVGHEVLVVPHSPDAGARMLPSELDLVCFTGLCSPEELSALSVDELSSYAERASERVRFTGPALASRWQRELEEARERSGRAPILYVQDIQVDGALIEWSGRRRRELSDFDLIPGQLIELKALARETKAIVAVGHCMPIDYDEGWRAVADLADETFTIERPDLEPADERRSRGETVRRVTSDRPVAETIEVFDYRFAEWR